MDLNTPISKASRAYKMYARRLEKLGITKLADFLYHVPFRYENYSLVSKIADAKPGETITVKGKLEEIENVYTRKWTTFQKATISDDTGRLNIIWFNQPFLTRALKKSDYISLSGKVTLDKGKPVMQSPQYEVIFENQTIHTGRLVPVYPETRGVSSKWLRRQVFNLLSQKLGLEEYLPDKIRKDNNLMGLWEAIEQIHFPKNMENAQKARERLAFDELFELQLSSLIRKKAWEKEKIKNPWNINTKKIEEFIKALPFKLTNSQENAVKDLLTDLSSEKAMNRLLQGDVGSGKTVVAAIGMFVAHLNGFKSIFMAPTEILANQHFKTISSFLKPFGVKVEILTGSNKGSDKNNFDVLVGTHALVYRKEKINKLGLVVIDEQQRFGVEQRGVLRKQAELAHLLTMTATPIPRTVALTLYGNLDLSILSDMPKGRIQIKTWLVPPVKRNGAYDWIKKQIGMGGQVFIVCPFIEESESMITVKAATKEFDRLQKEVFPNLKLGLLHGKLGSKEKDKILNSFREGKIDILVSTPVVEVGIDIPNANVMMIEEAERFGLAQLHQLRGRVGRGNRKSYCLLFTQSKNPETINRLKSLEKTYSGALLAELDLKLRGPGQIYGTAQHGIRELKIASFSDFELINKTKKEALNTFNKVSDFPALEKRISETLKKEVSPD